MNQTVMFSRAVIVASVLVMPVAASASASARSDAQEQVEFGIKVAQTGLWREAWNNLAIAYEHTGKFDDARKAYETALKLDPKNTLIRQNYDLFKEINDRTQKRRGGR